MDVLAELLRHTPRFTGKGRLLSHWLRTRTGQRTRVLPGGLSLALDMTVPYEAMIWIGWEEREELGALPRLLKAGDSFVDCGANIGLWSLVAAPIVGAAGHVDAFEANPRVAARLAENAGQSAVIRVHRAALSDQPGQVMLDLGTQHNLARVSERGEVPVPATTLDAALEHPPAGLKLDVEGHELQVLKGAGRTLAHRPWIVVEFNREHANAATLADWPVHRLLAELGYAATSVTGTRLDAGWGPERGYANILYRV